MKLRKLLSVLLIGAMTAALFAGCGSSGSEETASVASAGEESATAEIESASFAGFDDLQTIDMYLMSFYSLDESNIQRVEDKINEISEADINVHVNYHALDAATYMEQVGLMLSGGESMDLVACTAIPVVSFATMQAQGELSDISGYVDEYAPEMMSLMEKYIPATTVDGAIYAIPCYRKYNSSYYIIMRKDVLEELGLVDQAYAMKSWSDYEALLKQVQAAQDSLPEDLRTTAMLCNSDTQGTVQTQLYSDFAADNFADDSCFDVLGDSTKIITVDEETDTVQCYFASDDYRTTIERVYNWAQEGLIYKDAATDTNGSGTLCASGVTFSAIGSSETNPEISLATNYGHDLVAVKICDVPLQTGNVNMWAWAVPSTSENPEAAVAFLNLMYTNADIENLFVYGEEGVDYSINDSGEAVVNEEGGYMAGDFMYGNQFNAYAPEGSGADFREESETDLNNATMSKYYGFSVSTDPIANDLTALSNVLSKYESGLESGTLDPSNLDTMLDELNQSGLQTVIDYYQDALNTWIANN